MTRTYIIIRISLRFTASFLRLSIYYSVPLASGALFKRYFFVWSSITAQLLERYSFISVDIIAYSWECLKEVVLPVLPVELQNGFNYNVNSHSILYIFCVSKYSNEYHLSTFCYSAIDIIPINVIQNTGINQMILLFSVISTTTDLNPIKKSLSVVGVILYKHKIIGHRMGWS